MLFFQFFSSIFYNITQNGKILFNFKLEILVVVDRNDDDEADVFKRKKKFHTCAVRQPIEKVIAGTTII